MTEQSMGGTGRSAILDIYQLVLALFLFASPWLFAFAHGSLRADTWISAALVAAVSLVALVAFREWEDWINCGLGLWIAMSPWALGFQHTAGMFVNVTVGLLIAYLALLELWLLHYQGEVYGLETLIGGRRPPGLPKPRRERIGAFECL
jgi:hypothetical protein